MAVGDTDSVAALQASDLKVEGVFPVGNYPFSLAFDGANVWTVNAWENSVTKLRARNGAITRKVAVGDDPTDILYDGSSIWVTNTFSNTVSKITHMAR